MPLPQSRRTSSRPRLALIALLLTVLAGPSLVSAANPIVVENQKTGTAAWQIGQSPYTASNDTDMEIRGYASAVSINKGNKITFNITVNPLSWKAGTSVPFYIDIYRIGWYGGTGGRQMLHLGPFTGVQQPGGTSSGGVTSPGCPYDATSGMIACQWTGDGKGNGSYTLDTSLPTMDGTADWTSGIYLALLTTSQMQYGPTIDPDHQTYIIFTIREDARSSAVLFQQAVATYQAYNNYPNDGLTGKSLYDSGSFGPLTTLGTERAVKVSFDRPYTYSDHTGAGLFLEWELYFVRWLERNGYDVTYTTDIDVHANGASYLEQYKAVVIAGHSEYWSAQMRAAFEGARDNGTSIGVFGANTMFNQIRLEPSPVSGVANRVVVGYKDASLDPVNNPSNPAYNPSLTTVAWRNPPVNLPEQQDLGLMYIDYIPPPALGGSYIVQNSSHWIYANTGFANGTSVPGILGYELDQQYLNSMMPSAKAGTYVLLSNSPFVGENYTTNANSSIYQASAGPGAWVFNAGTIYWSLGLDSYSPPAGINTGSVPAPSAGIQQATANFLNTVTGATLPAAPTALTATAVSGTSINLAWTNNAPNATAILVQGSPDGVTFAQIASLSGSATSYSNTGLMVNTVYYYRVSAQNAVGTSGFSNVAKATTLGVPAAPTGLTATPASTTSINLAWTNNATNATAVVVQSSPDGVTFTQIASLAATATTYTNTGLTTNTLYYYRVGAQNATGTSGWSNTASATTQGVPAAPTALTATAASTTSVNLAWTNNATNATAVLVESSPNNVNFTQIASLAATVTSYTNTGLTSSTLYYYRVRAQNATGFSGYSNTASTITLGVPAIPTGLTASSASATSIVLTWTNAAINATAVLVESSVDNVTFAQIASLAATATTYTNTGLTTNTLHYYRVRAQNASGNSGYSNTASATAGGIAAPSALTATAASTTSITINWTNNATGLSYNGVELSTDGVTFTHITDVAGTTATYTDTGLATSTLYYFRVVAVNNGTSSPYSNIASATTQGVPPAPSALTATAASATSINLAWTNNATNATAVLVERSPNNTTFTQIASLAATVAAYADTGLTTNTIYYYRVRAQNSSGFSAYSATASATTLGTPAAPTALTATPSSTTAITLAWTNTATNATAILVQRSPDNVTFTQIASLAGNATTYSNTGLTANTLYYYRVAAQNAVGTSAWSNTASASTAIPPAPTALTANSASTTSIALAWTNTGTNATAILVQSSTDGVTFAQIASLAGTATTYTNTGLTTNTLYYYRVSAQNAIGTSGYSNVASTTTSGVPAAPSALTATAASTTSVNLAWTNNATNGTAVLVERSPNNTTFTQIVSLAATATTYTNTGLTTNTLYYYRVRAQNATGFSAYSNTASVTTSGIPTAPTGLTAAVATATTMNLAWTNTAANATAVLVQQSTNNSTFTQIASLAATATTYTATGLTSGTTYYFRVSAQNSAGTSGNSNTVTISAGMPAAPSGVAAGQDNAFPSSQVDVYWTDNSNNETGFLVFRSPDGVTFTQIATAPAGSTEYMDTGLAANTNYYYYIKGANAAGASAASNTDWTTTAP